MTRDLLSRLYAHLDWADQRLLERVNADAEVLPEEAMRLLAHLIAAERVWILRLTGQDSSVQPVWPEPDISEIISNAESNRSAYRQYLEALREEDLTSEIAYKTQRGETYRTQACDILLHVALHGSYHRGQIAKLMRAAGGEPVNTDYITFVREEKQ